jgi:hypothetical protein
MDRNNLFPLIIPSDYLSSAWKLPHEKFPINEFALTWVLFEGSSTMTYLTEDEYENLNENSQNWQQRSFENLRFSSDFFHTNVKYSSQNNSVVFISFLNDDGIGSTRILLNFELSRAFKNGYSVAFPDRSCGLVIPKDIPKKDLDETKMLVRKMYKTATTPMTDKIYDSDQFVLPENWTLPIDKDFSNQIIEKLIAND